MKTSPNQRNQGQDWAVLWLLLLLCRKRSCRCRRRDQATVTAVTCPLPTIGRRRSCSRSWRLSRDARRRIWRFRLSLWTADHEIARDLSARLKTALQVKKCILNNFYSSGILTIQDFQHTYEKNLSSSYEHT